MSLSPEQALEIALAHHRAGRLAEAGAIYRQVLAQQPGHADALHLLGLIASATGHHGEAAGLFREAITARPGQPEFLASLGEALTSLGQLDEAAASFQQALTLQPDRVEHHTSLAFALSQRGRWQEAATSYRRAAGLRPDCAETHGNLGFALAQTGRTDEAIACYERGLALKPDFAEALANLNDARLSRHQFAEMITFDRELLRRSPELPEAHWSLALTLLLLGQFEEGWREYEWRWRLAGFPSPRRNFRAPQWDGSRVPGATILLHAEQGHGDTIQFMRYVPLVREHAQASRVIVECPPQLARLLAQGGGWDAEIVARQDWEGSALPSFDFHLPLLSLPLALRKFEPLAMATPYLRADSRGHFQDAPRAFRVGLAWAGHSMHKDDRRRSMPPDALAPLLRVEGVEFFSLQVGATPGRSCINPRMHDLTSHIADFADTAALMMELDLIISADTAVAHLAGALGRPVWTLLHFVPDWRWGLGREDTPWYPTMRLLRQRTAGDWDELIQRAANELAAIR